eukprot:gene18199-20015_t
MGCGTRLVKTLMFIANTIFALAGLALLALAIYIRVQDSDYNTVFGKGGPFAPANIMIAAGCVVFIISFFGCCGAVKEWKWMLVIFIIFIVLVLMCETAMIVLAFVYRAEAERYATDAITTAIQKTYGQTGQTGVTKAIDSIQKNFKCCGATTYTDWAGALYIKAQNTTRRVPDSCCSTVSTSCTSPTSNSTTDIFSKACIPELTTWAKKNLAIIGGLAAGVILIELFAILFAAILIKRSDSVHAA